tara:strand:+ start:13 stop:507 length:495 start_codon:yes stop_codon:yes gene_type:complete
MNRRNFLTLVPATAALTWTVTCKFEEEGHKEEEAKTSFELEYFYVTSTYWDENQMLQNAIVSDYDLSERRFSSIQNACDNIQDHNKKYFDRLGRMHTGFKTGEEAHTVDYQIWYHGFDGKESMVGELTLGKNGVHTFYKQWVMNREQFAATEAEHNKRARALYL